MTAPSSPRSDDPLALLRTTEPKREPPQKALMRLVVAAVVMAAILGAYIFITKRAYAVKQLVADAMPFIEKGDVPSLRQAEAKLKEAEERGGGDNVKAALSEVYAMLAVEHAIAAEQTNLRQYAQAAVSSGIENGGRFVGEALLHHVEGRSAEGKRVLDSVLARGGVSDKIYWALGTIELGMGEAKLAKDHLSRAVDTKPQAPHYGRALGDAFDDLGDPRSASTHWEAAARANPAYVQGAARDLISQLRRGEPRKQVVETFKVLEGLNEMDVGSGGTAALAYARATMHWIEGNEKAARKAIDAAITAGGETARHLELRGRIQLNAGKPGEGLKDIAAAHAKAPKADRYLYGLVDAYADAGKHDEALKVMTAAAATHAEDPAYHTALGNLHVQRGEPQKAQAAFEKAHSLSADYADAYLGQAIGEWRQKKFDEAMPFFEKAIMAKPKFPEVYEAIGLMWTEQGALPRANPQLDMGEKLFRAIDADPARMQRFYAVIQKTMNSAKGGSSLAKEWAGREKAYREGTQPPLP